MIKGILLTISLSLLLCHNSIGEVKVINHFTEEEILPNNDVKRTILPYPKYYKDSDTLKEVDTDIVASDDVGWDWEVKKGVYETHVKNDGTFEINHLGDKYSQKLLGIGFYNTDTKEKVIKSNLTLSSPVVNGSEITWSLPLGSSYKLFYGNNIFKDILTISQQAKNYLKANKPDGWTAQNTWIGLIYDMDLSQSPMIESKDFESDNDIKFISNGKVKHRIRRAIVKHGNWDNNPDADNTDKQWLKKKIYKNGKYVEAIPVLALESEDGSLIFNTTVTFQEGVSGYSGCIDTYIRSGGNANTNYDATDALFCKWADVPPGFFNRGVLIAFDVSDIPSSGTVTSTALSLTFGNDIAGNNTLYLHDCLRTWVEAQATWNIYSTGNSWTTAGCRSDGNDLDGTAGTSTGALSSMAVSTADDIGESRDFGTSAGMVASAQAAVDASGSVNWVIHGNIGTNIDLWWHDSEQATAGFRPLLTIIYTPAAGGVPQVMIISR